MSYEKSDSFCYKFVEEHLNTNILWQSSNVLRISIYCHRIFFSVFLGSCQVNDLGAERVRWSRSHYSVRLANFSLNFRTVLRDYLWSSLQPLDKVLAHWMTAVKWPWYNILDVLNNVPCKLVNAIRSVIDLSSTVLDLNSTCSFVCLFAVGEEDELSIKEAAELVVEGMQFTGELEVSFVNWIFKGLLYVRGGLVIEVHLRGVLLARNCGNLLKYFTFN